MSAREKKELAALAKMPDSTIDTSDIPEITDKALFEAHLYYAVPRYMDKPECQAFIRQMLPKTG